MLNIFITFYIFPIFYLFFVFFLIYLFYVFLSLKSLTWHTYTHIHMYVLSHAFTFSDVFQHYTWSFSICFFAIFNRLAATAFIPVFALNPYVLTSIHTHKYTMYVITSYVNNIYICTRVCVCAYTLSFPYVG